MEGEEYWPSCKLGQFEPERAAVGASQHEHEPAAKTYSGIFCYIGSEGLWPPGQSAGAQIQQKNEADTKQLTGGPNVISVAKAKKLRTNKTQLTGQPNNISVSKLKGTMRLNILR